MQSVFMAYALNARASVLPLTVGKINRKTINTPIPLAPVRLQLAHWRKVFFSVHDFAASVSRMRAGHGPRVFCLKCSRTVIKVRRKQHINAGHENERAFVHPHRMETPWRRGEFQAKNESRKVCCILPASVCVCSGCSWDGRAREQQQHEEKNP